MKATLWFLLIIRRFTHKRSVYDFPGYLALISRVVEMILFNNSCNFCILAVPRYRFVSGGPCRCRIRSRPCSWVVHIRARSVPARSILAAITWRQERRVYPKHHNLYDRRRTTCVPVSTSPCRYDEGTTIRGIPRATYFVKHGA